MSGGDHGRVSKAYVDIADGQIHCRRRSGVAPPIVFLHQTALSSRCYEPLLREIPLPNELLAFDLPGFGASFRPDGWPTMTQYAAWIVSALDALDVAQIYLFGHHTGASLATEIAHRHPDRVLGLMLCGAVCFSSEESAAFRDDFKKPLAPVADGSHLLLNWRYTADHNQGIAPEIIQDQAIDMLMAWRARPQAYVAVADHDFQHAFRQLTTPTVLLTSPGDYFEDHVARCRALRPDVGVVSVGGGNLAPEIDSTGVARRIEDFVAQVTAI